MNNKPYISSDTENEAINVMVRNIVSAIGQYNSGFDRSFQSVVKDADFKNKTYTILDQVGIDRKVKCVIPNANLQIGNHVIVTMPCSNINQAYISGVL